MLVKKSAKRLANSAKVLYNKIMRGSTGAGAEREQRTRFGCKQYGAAAVPAGRGGGFVLPKRHLSKGEYDYDLFAASTEYVPDHQRS